MIRFLALTPALVLAISAQQPDASAEPVELIAFASCFKDTRPAPALESIAGIEPDVFIWMGDNVYADTTDMDVLRAKYQAVREHPGYARLRSEAEVIGTWDDHDYGANDVGKEYPEKEASQQALLDFLDVPEDSPRREREGVYSASDFGPPERRVRVILLDTRYHRDPVGSDGTMLGETQWQWLEDTLAESTAAVNVLVSSIQFLPQEQRFEKWENFPAERQRMLDLLASPEIPPVVILSGDRHLAEISLDDKSAGYPLYDITSSSLNLPLGGDEDEPNPLRVGRNFRPSNFGTLTIDWTRDLPVLTACIRDAEGIPQRAISFELTR